MLREHLGDALVTLVEGRITERLAGTSSGVLAAALQ
jgi:hypothetical protein